MKKRLRYKVIGLLLILAIITSGICLNIEEAYSLFSDALTIEASITNGHILNVNNEASLEASTSNRSIILSSNREENNSNILRLVNNTFINNYSFNMAYYFSNNICNIKNISFSNLSIIHFIHQQDGKK